MTHSTDTIKAILEQLEHMDQALSRHESQLNELLNQAEAANAKKTMELQLPDTIRRMPPKV